MTEIPRSPLPIDPVCGMTVDPATAAGSFVHRGTTYYFCARSCLDRFARDPESFLEKAHAQAMPDHGAAEDTREYTCPMDPDIRQVGPGVCPKCGMALEPVTAAEGDRNPELDDMTRRLRIGGALTLPILAFMVSDLVPGQPLQRVLPAAAARWIQFALATPVVCWAGWPFFVRGWSSVVNRHLNMFTLIAAGVGAAYAYSVVATIWPSWFPHAVGGHSDGPGVYFEAAAVIVVLVIVGQVLELRARGRTGDAIRRLIGLQPKTARRVALDGLELDVPIDEVRVGDTLRIRPGERVPVDGVVIDGRTAIDESMVTGEPMPADKAPGAAVTGGTINATGSILIESRRVGADTLLAQIVRLVGEAQRSRAPIQRLADTVSAWFVPAVIVASVVTFVVWWTIGPEPRGSHALVNAVAVLIIACPCALGLATPMSVMVGTGRGAELGILFRNAEALELLGRVDVVVIDKTGTLTEGRPAVTVEVPADPAGGSHEWVRLAASLEKASEHSLAGAVVAYAVSQQMVLGAVHEFSSVPGKGVTGRVDGHQVIVGSDGFLAERGIDTASVAPEAERRRNAGETAIFAAVDGRLAGLLVVADPVKASSSSAIAALRADGIRVVMLTGDNTRTAEAVGRAVGIAEIRAGLLPAGKAEVVAALRGTGRTVAMAGDGVNDAPALAAADVGIAMGTGTDVAIESAGVTLVKGDLGSLVRARQLSRATLQNIRQNLFFAFVYNVVGVPIAAGVLYPAFGILLSPVIASAAMTFSSVSVIANALRLRKAVAR
jgi:Cu+-exporting ATPase